MINDTLTSLKDPVIDSEVVMNLWKAYEQMINETIIRINESVNLINEFMIYINEPIVLINETIHYKNESIILINETIHYNNESIILINETIQLWKAIKQPGNIVWPQQEEPGIEINGPGIEMNGPGIRINETIIRKNDTIFRKNVYKIQRKLLNLSCENYWK